MLFQKKHNEFLFDIEYNLSCKTISLVHKGSAPITLEQKQFIKEKLIEAINYASEITINKTKNNIIRNFYKINLIY